MRILHVVPSYLPAVRYGGPIWSVHALCQALVRRGHEIDVFTTSMDGPNDLQVPLAEPVNRDGVRVCYFPSRFLRRAFWSPALGQRLRARMRDFQFLHLHSVYLWPTSAAAREAEKSRVPWCVAPRGALVPELVQRKSSLQKRVWIALKERRTLEGAAFIHATSDLEAHDVQRFGFRLRGIRVVPNGVDLPQACAAAIDPAARGERRRSLLFLGRISWKKGLDRLIPALVHVPGDVDLIVAGNDEEDLTPKLRQMALQAGVAGRVRFVGSVLGDAKTRLLQEASALVLPSYSENFGNVVLESLACGRPVAVTREVGLAPVIEKSESGIVIPGEPVAMGQALTGFLSSASALEDMGRRGRRLVENEYSWDAVAARMEDAYRAALR